MTDDPDAISQIMNLVGDKWTLLVLDSLRAGSLRFSQLRRRAAPISQTMLTRTLRTLEHHALIERTVLPATPPHVQYAMTALGESFLAAAGTLCTWAHENNLKPHPQNENFTT